MTSAEIIQRHLEKTKTKRFRENAWGIRHCMAFEDPNERESIAQLIVAWGKYADAHRQLNNFPIGDECVLGPCWEEIGHNLVHLLNGDTGRLDGGALDCLIRDLLEANSFERNW